MDNLTHSLVGALLGQAGLNRRTGLAMPALILGANLPDIDAACVFWLDGVEHLGFRRGITHGPPAWVLLPLVLAAILWGWDRGQARRGTRPRARLPVSFGWLFGLSFIACLTHPALDWLNVYGIRLLEPFSSRWFYGDALFIIDLWLWLGMGVASWLSLRRERQGGDWRKPAQIGLAATLAYVVLNVGITRYHERVKGVLAEPYPVAVIAAPVPLLFWQRERLVVTNRREWRWLSTRWTGPSFGYGYRHPDEPPCRLPNYPEVDLADPQFGAFAFWSRAPLAVRAADGSVLLRDARFYDPRVRDRFTVALPNVRCQPL